MAAIINTNIASLTAQRNLSGSQSALQTSLARLSSGLRINSAKDDAAGMAIADRMTSQIRGLNQASRNANDGVSLSQVAEAGLGTATDLLQRMRELAVQSANSTNSASDRASLQSEATQIMAEIDRVAKTTNFNGLSLLDGSFTAQQFQVGANSTAADRIQISSIANMQTASLGTGQTGSASLTSGKMTAALTAGDLTLNGIQVGTATAGGGAGQTADSAWATAQAINLVGGQSGVTAIANATVATEITVAGVAPTAGLVASNSFTINGISIGEIKAGVVFDATTTPPTAGGPTTVIAQSANVAEAINKVSKQSGVIATVDNTGKVSLTSTNGKSIDVRMTDTAVMAKGALLTKAGLLAADSTDPAGTGAVVAAVLPTTGAIAAAGNFKINGVAVGAIADGGTVQGQGANVAAAINLISGQTGVTATADAITGAMTLTAADGRDIVLEDGTTTALAATGIAAATFRGNITLQSSNVNGIVVGGKNDKYAGLHAFEGQVAANISGSNGALSSVDISTASGAIDALKVIDNALTAVNSARGVMGALQNRFEGVVSNLSAASNNLSAARSRIQDTDFAAETAQLTRNQILQQAGTAMLAQANQLPSMVLSLLK